MLEGSHVMEEKPLGRVTSTFPIFKTRNQHIIILELLRIS